jgi:hypothetical protein
MCGRRGGGVEEKGGALLAWWPRFWRARVGRVRLVSTDVRAD